MTRVNSRQKGARGEREWAAYLRDHGIDARRGQQFSGSPDSPDVVSEMLGRFVHMEVKRVEALRLEPAMAQAERDCPENKVPVVVHRKNRTPWLVTLRAVDAVPLILAAINGGWEVDDE